MAFTTRIPVVLVFWEGAASGIACGESTRNLQKCDCRRGYMQRGEDSSPNPTRVVREGPAADGLVA